MESKRKSRLGHVVSDKMDKTVVVAVETPKRHRLYKKTLRRVARYKAHDEKNKCQVGDKVIIVETRPLSREKRWRVAEIVAKAEVVEISPEEIAREDLARITPEKKAPEAEPEVKAEEEIKAEEAEEKETKAEAKKAEAKAKEKAKEEVEATEARAKEKAKEEVEATEAKAKEKAKAEKKKAKAKPEEKAEEGAPAEEKTEAEDQPA
jgi:small subunit ribosomal protein S17